MIKTPLTLITGSLGSGKTTLVKHILDTCPKKLAILMNEFGEINIDGKILKGKNVAIAELQDGCVCCSLIGEFEAAVEEIIEQVKPAIIVVETTGVAEPDALIYDIEENLPLVRLDGVVTVVDADLMVRFPSLGPATKMQIADADILLLNKQDMVSKQELENVSQLLQTLNPRAAIIQTTYAAADPALLFGIVRKEQLAASSHIHQLDYQSVNYQSKKLIDEGAFRSFLEQLPRNIVRAKGFVNFEKGCRLLNFVNGKWTLEPYEEEENQLVFIGKNLDSKQLMQLLQECEITPV